VVIHYAKITFLFVRQPISLDYFKPPNPEQIDYVNVTTNNYGLHL